MAPTAGQVKAGNAYVELYCKDTTDKGLRSAQGTLDRYAQHVQAVQAKLAAATAAGNAQQAAGLQQALGTIRQKQGAAALGVQLRQKSDAAMTAAGAAMRAEDTGPLARQNLSLGGKAGGAGQEMDGAATAAIRLGAAVVAVNTGVVVMRGAIAAIRGDWDQVSEAVDRLPLGLGRVLKDTKSLGEELAHMAHQLWKGTGGKDLEQEATDYANGVQTKREALEKLTAEMKRAAEYAGATPQDQARMRAEDAYQKRLTDIQQQAEGVNAGDDAGAIGEAKAAAAEELRVALAAIPPAAAQADEQLQKAQQNADQVAQALGAAEHELATLGMTPEQRQIFDLRALRVAAQQVDEIARVQAKITEEKRKQALADTVAATIADAERAAAVAGKTPTEARLYDLAHPAAGAQAANPEQLAKVKAAWDAADAAAKAAADAAAKQQDMDQFVAGVQDSMKTDAQRMTETQRKVFAAIAAGKMTGAEGGAYLQAMQGKLNPALPESVKGTFSGSAAAMALGGGAPADRTAKATERTAKAVERIAETADRGGGTFTP
jgi:hypothetical protein